LSIAFDSPSSRPSRTEIEPVALDLIRRRGAEVLSSARRYACTPDDAEDAYQRALEILLTKAPTTREDELLPWLKTVVRHECFALRKKRERDVPVEHGALDGIAGSEVHAADERAERYDRLRVGAEALGRLKPQETRALLLKAEGLSYQEIAAQTGWTYTKVNRCLTEGRRAFFARVHGIESGEECERLDPLLSAMADGEATVEDMAALRPHLRGCSSCRATLRDYREAPVRVRDLSAPVATAGFVSLLGDRVWSFLRSLFEGAVAHKAAVVAASTAAVAGGGAATMQAVGDHPPQRAVAPAPKVATQARPVATPSPRQSTSSTPTRRRRRAPVQKPAPRRSAPTAPARQTAPAPKPTPVPAASPAPAPSPAVAPPQAEPRPTTPPAPADPGGGEFGP
jgi:RNA polymerase sigma factor (sigma-70 family)